MRATPWVRGPLLPGLVCVAITSGWCVEYYFDREIRTLVDALHAVNVAIAEFERLERNLRVTEKEPPGRAFTDKSGTLIVKSQKRRRCRH